MKTKCSKPDASLAAVLLAAVVAHVYQGTLKDELNLKWERDRQVFVMRDSHLAAAAKSLQKSAAY